MLQQCLPFTVCAEGCEAAEEQSDDEVRTSQVPEQSEGKTKMMRKWSLPFTVLKLPDISDNFVMRIFGCNSSYCLRYAPKSARQQRSGETMRSAHLKCLNEVKVKRKWSVNSAYRSRYWNFVVTVVMIDLPCLVATVLTVYGMRRRVWGSRGAKRRWGPHIASTWTKWR